MENIVGLCDMKLEMYGLENHLGKTMPCSIFYHSINAYFFFFPYITDGVFYLE